MCPLEVWPKAQKADLPYRGTKKSDSKTDFRFVFSDLENGRICQIRENSNNFFTVSFIYGRKCEKSRYRLLNISDEINGQEC